MRTLSRALVTSALVAVIAIAGSAGAAFAAAPYSNGNGTNFEMYEEWCFVDETIFLCFEVHGRWTIVDQDDGDQIGTAAVHTRAYVIEDGVVASASLDHSVFQTKFVDGVAEKELLISQNRTLTPGQQCVAHVLLKYEAGVIVVDQASMSCN